MGKRLKRWKSWKWPIGAAGFIVVLLGVHAVKTSPEFAEAQAAESHSKAAMDDTVRASEQSGADAWMERRENGSRMEGRDSFGHRGRGGGFSDSDSEESQGGNFSNRDGAFGSTSRTS
ncbi:hypothetical protein PaecuDRAFT_3921 [Paenibacillus curdlanolyticus YK9]|uniref:Uncharacterized protein n=1 Tax=Paenibacillus curdlanolyticus YK9 TaxID=717606 RepID=E0IE30_9BACL|nr:hypothetical protein [Paenibacillus curdlanolyticus]EFM09384.1 hypothetical protein PaecuDRAFT_3921 [Paenibacillus curdlanolyticus YK9]